MGIGKKPQVFSRVLSLVHTQIEVQAHRHRFDPLWISLDIQRSMASLRVDMSVRNVRDLVQALQEAIEVAGQYPKDVGDQDLLLAYAAKIVQEPVERQVFYWWEHFVELLRHKNRFQEIVEVADGSDPEAMGAMDAQRIVKQWLTIQERSE